MILISIILMSLKVIAGLALVFLLGAATVYACMSEESRVAIRNHQVVINGYAVMGEAQIEALANNSDENGVNEVAARNHMELAIHNYISNAKVWAESDRVVLQAKLVAVAHALFPVPNPT